MFWKLLLLFTIVPIVELTILVKLSVWTESVLLTVGLVILTGIAGAALAKHQGLAVLKRIQHELAEGKIPGDRILDGLIILVAAALLVTPGVLTDALGLLMLIPPARAGVRALIKKWLAKKIQAGKAKILDSTDFHVFSADDDADERK